MIKYLLLFTFVSLSIVPAQHFRNWKWDGDWDNGAPFIEFTYGASKMDLRKSAAEFNDPGYVNLKLGYADYDKDFDNIAEYEATYFEAANVSTKLNSEKLNGKMNTDMWRFGFGRKEALGYYWGDFAILPYSSGSINWSKVKVDNYESPAEGEMRDPIDNFHDKMKFGTLAEGGISIQPIEFVSVNVGYEKAAVFQGVLFWKFLGSAAIEVVGAGLLDEFIDEIRESSPVAAPIANFLLKNGLSFAMYQLRKDKMNWPFDSEPPITYDTFKFGLTFNF